MHFGIFYTCDTFSAHRLFRTEMYCSYVLALGGFAILLATFCYQIFYIAECWRSWLFRVASNPGAVREVTDIVVSAYGLARRRHLDERGWNSQTVQRMPTYAKVSAAHFTRDVQVRILSAGVLERWGPQGGFLPSLECGMS